MPIRSPCRRRARRVGYEDDPPPGRSALGLRFGLGGGYGVERQHRIQQLLQIVAVALLQRAQQIREAAVLLDQPGHELTPRLRR